MDYPKVIRRCVPAGIRSLFKNLLGISTLQQSIRECDLRFQQSIRECDLRFLATDRRLDNVGSRLVAAEVLPPEVETAAGYLQALHNRNGLFTVKGWIMLPDRELHAAMLSINGTRIARVPLTPSDTSARSYPYAAYARRVDFDFRVPLSKEDTRGFVGVVITGLAGGKEVARMIKWYHDDLDADSPILPPPAIMKRSIGTTNRDHFLITGLQSFKEFWDAICRHTDPGRVTRMLEWGCGCGRMTRFFIRHTTIPEIHGCDIDAEAVRWCSNNLSPGRFATSGPYPPTLYADNQFDCVIAYSVLTHLARDLQLKWLDELARILGPGGLLLASVHGEFAASLVFHPRALNDLLAEGIDDGMKDSGLDGIAEPGYYRGVFQTKEYAFREYSRHFEILDYLERGALNQQDLIIMRKRAG
ncbi:MAG: class I SAM-dependent methyltransferase [bacterium]|nr:class I SAM-dependent methyltransferase [bacterium]